MKLNAQLAPAQKLALQEDITDPIATLLIHSDLEEQIIQELIKTSTPDEVELNISNKGINIDSIFTNY